MDNPLFWFIAFWFFALVIAIGVFIARVVRRLLLLCAPESRTIHPNVAWLILLGPPSFHIVPASRTIHAIQWWLDLVAPLYLLVFGLFLVLRVESTLENEFRRRQMTPQPTPRKAVGITMCVSAVGGWTPLIGFFSVLGTLLGTFLGLVHFVCWVRYWVYLVETSRVLSGAPPAASPPSSTPPPLASGPPSR